MKVVFCPRPYSDLVYSGDNHVILAPLNLLYWRPRSFPFFIYSMSTNLNLSSPFGLPLSHIGSISYLSLDEITNIT